MLHFVSLATCSEQFRSPYQQLKQQCDCNDPKAHPDGHSTERPKAGRIGTASNAGLKGCINHFSTPVGTAVNSAALSFAAVANKHSLEMQRAPTMMGESRRGRCAAPKRKSRFILRTSGPPDGFSFYVRTTPMRKKWETGQRSANDDGSRRC